MSNLTTVTLTAGSPTSGTGTVSTIDALMADGGQTTIGTQTDAKSTATDTTAASVVSILKQISASSQTVPTHAVTQSGTWTVQPGNTANTTAWKVDASSVAVPVTDNSGSLTVDNGGTFAVQAAQSGTWNVTNVSGTVSLPTGAATSAKQPALGTAGTASTDVISVQGISSMTALKTDGSAVTQPVSASSLPLPTGAATLAKQPALGTAGSASADVISVQGVASMTALKVDGSAVTQPVSAASLPLPTGGSTSAKQPALGTAGSASTDVLSIQGIASMTKLLVTPDANSAVNVAQINGVTPLMGNGTTGTGSQRVTIASDNTAFSTNSVQSGTWTVQPGNTANTTAWKVDGSAVTQPVSLASVPSHAVTNAGTFAVQNTPAVTGQTTMSGSAPVAMASNQSWPTGMSPRSFSAAFTTLTRPANTTAYTAADSISDNGTAGSVTALSATLSDTNDDPITITEILISSTDTGLAGKRIRAYLFNSDPTASTGVGGGDNAAFSQKKAGYIGAMSGVLETGFSDGTVGRLTASYNDGAAASTPNASAGGFIVTKPTSGAKTIFIQYQAIDAFTPSANSTTIIGTARGFQGRGS